MGAEMDISQFNYKSSRAYKARLGHMLAPWAISLQISVILLAIAGIALLLVFHLPIGWAVLGFSAIPIMIFEWFVYELRRVPIIKGGKRFDELLESEILGVLSAQPTPKELASALSLTTGGLFFATRFAVSGGFLEQVVSEHREDTAAVYEEALSIAAQTGGKVTAGVLILALVRQLPGKTSFLGHLQLDEDDLIRGIKWYNYLINIIELQKNRAKQPGGIGRDWSFGWIPTLSRYGQNISRQSLMTSDVRTETLDSIVRSLESGSNSIALVGKDGVGKTELVYQLAAKLMDPQADIPEKLRYKQIFMLDAGRLVGAANERGGLEYLIESLLGEAFAAKNIIVCLDNAQVFFEDGVGSVDVANLLLPILSAARLPIILTMDEQRFLQISKRTPGLAKVVNRINVHPTSESDTLKALENHVPQIEFSKKVTFMYQALRESYKLGARYVYDTAMPGQAISLLDAAADYSENGLVTARSVNLAIEKTIGVKTSVVDDENERDTLLNMEALIHERMIGQDHAVTVVSDALRRARAGVRNQKRPVGTFMFLGPTGVGKTELAKSLAAVYYGGEDNIIRLDMNEFVSSDDVARLIADGADDAGSLTAQVMKQPFSVILLDEIEKAHSSVLSTLLQLLDEGILRDVRNREVSFRDAIVIATSNAGSDRIQEYLHRGYQLEQFEDTFINELLGSNVFHPEFLNRFDELVVFGPLSKSELLKVVDIILIEVNKNLATQKITVDVTQDAKEYLVETGYDPRLGARPMRRVVQRAVENTVAKEMLARNVEAGGTVQITLEQVQSLLQKTTKADKIIAENK